MKKFLILILSISVLPAFSQGTVQDYKRAYSLVDKFKSDNVFHWAQGIQWHDSTHVLHYTVQTPEGKRFVVFDADRVEKKMFASEKEMRDALGDSQQERRPPRGFRPGRVGGKLHSDSNNVIGWRLTKRMSLVW